MKIGIILPLGEDEELGRPQPYSYLRSMAQQAEAAGFDSVWVYDHLLYRFPDKPTTGIWECWSVLAGIAEATERVELGTLVMCVPFRNPALLAKMAITTDEIAGGRLILGIGAGWHQPEFDAFGVPFHHLADQFEEGLQIISPLLKEGKVDFHGTYFSAPDCEMRPRGPRPGGPPILIASRGPRMLRLTAQYADQWNTAWFGQPTIFRERHADMLRACEEVGRDPATLAITAGVTVAFPELASDLPETVNDPDKVLKGTPEEIATGLKAYADLGVSHVICVCAPATTEAVAELTRALHVYRSL